jgi:DNA modification methylase
MAPSIVEDILRERKKPLLVLDPMAGSGTTLAMAASLGHKAIGFDTDPLAVLLSSTLSIPVDETKTIRTAKRILRSAREAYNDLEAITAYPSHASIQEKEFLRYWFCRKSRKQLHCLSLRILRLRNKFVQRILWIAFSRMIIKKDNGVSLAADISHSRPHRVYNTSPVKPFDSFLTCVEKVLHGIKNLNLSNPTKITARLGDARRLLVKNESIDLIITSPPYFNAIDYMRGHKMSLIWMGYRLPDLKSIRSTNVGAETGQQLAHRDIAITNALRKIGPIKRLPQRQVEMLSKFVWDMNLIIQETSRVLVPRGEAFFVIGDSNLKGTFIKNSAALKSLAKSNGFEVFKTTRRNIPDNRRYLPPPSRMGRDSLGLRMRTEVVIGLRKINNSLIN